MITIREVSRVTWDITELTIIGRNPQSSRYLHEWIIGDKLHISMYQWHDIRDGKLTAIEQKINAHGDRTRGGFTEMAWGLKEKTVPPELLDAPITHMCMTSRGSWNGVHLRVDVEINQLTVECLNKRLNELAMKWEAEEDDEQTKNDE